MNCTPLTSSVSIEYLEGNKITQGHATRKREGWFRVDLVDNREFKVKEEDLCITQKYTKSRSKNFMLAAKRRI